MIDEKLYMEIRLFREFCTKFGFSASGTNELFKKHKIWQYIEENPRIWAEDRFYRE